MPYDVSSSFRRGAAKAPQRIREALASPAGNPWSEALVDISDAAVLADVGDVPEDRTDYRSAIESHAARIFAAGSLPISLGGDHAVTLPLVRAVSRHYPHLSILHIDAHADLYDAFEGDRFSHASPFARIMEEELAARLVQVGIRTMTPHQREQADRFHVEVIDMRAWAAGERPHFDGDEKIYLSLDLDGLDPAFAPGVSHPEPGGLSVRDVLTLIQTIEGSFVGADIVEYNPDVDATAITAVVAAKFVKEIAARMYQQEQP